MIYTVNTASICVLLARETFSFREYIDTIYLTITSIAFNLQLGNLIFTMKKLFTIIGMIEGTIENSELNF